MGNRETPFSLAAQGQQVSVWRSAFNSAVENILALKHLNSLYQRSVDASPAGDFVSSLLDTMNVSYSVSGNALEHIPRTGPVVVVSNHPFGGLEGVIVIDLLQKIRPDVKVMANFLLSRIPAMRKHFFFVDPFGTERAAKSNLQPLRQTIRWLNEGGLVSVFPSGTVSHFQFRTREVTDPEWSLTIARVIRLAKVPAVPLYFGGANGLLFQLLGLIHPLLRTALLPRQLHNKCNSIIDIKVGGLIPYEKLASFSSDQDMLAYLRLRTYILGSQETGGERKPGRFFWLARPLISPPEQVIPAVDPLLIKDEVNALPAEQRLLQHGDFQVWYGWTGQLQHTLREIGRLREVTFREANEGTGKSIDLDRFDDYYIHLFVYNRSTQEIIGAYRLVDASWVARVFGLKGLYTHTLFAYKPSILRQVGPALELGRSFVRSEYQKNYISLNLLWKGIAHYVSRNPQYTGLFGTVSISSQYDSVSRNLIMLFLTENNYLPELAKLIRARNPMRQKRLRGIDSKATSIVVRDLQDVNEILVELRSQQRSIPILLKQYLKLNGKLLGFNVDKNFGNVLDGLIYVDLRETDPKLLERYMGREGAQQFLSLHCRWPGQNLEKTGTCD